MTLRVRILGSGTSQGIPRIACDCPVCTSTDPLDHRYRASALLAFGERRVLVDCGPDFKWQALAADLRRLDAVLLTHDHQDAIGGLDELRRFNELSGDYLPVHARAEDLDMVVGRWAYAFRPGQRTFFGLPQLRPVALDGPFLIGGRRFVPVPVIHGDRVISGYRTGGFAYCSDVQRIDPDGMALLRDLDVLVISALRDQPHPTHQTVAEALAVIEALAATPGLPDPPGPRAGPRGPHRAPARRRRGCLGRPRARRVVSPEPTTEDRAQVAARRRGVDCEGQRGGWTVARRRATAGVRNVRAPRRRVAGNARPPRGEDQRHRDESAAGQPAAG